MKTLLAALSTFSVVTPATLSPIATKSIANEKLESIWSAPTSMEALQESVDKYYESKQKLSVFWFEGMRTALPSRYWQFCANKTGTLESLDMNPLSEKVEQTFQDVYTNNTPNQQTYQTQEYSKEISNTSTFTVEIRESVALSFSTSFMFAELSIAADLSSTQTWSETKTVTETVTAPSQAFIVDPFSKGIASYVIKSGLYNNKGVLRYRASLTGNNNGFRTRRYTNPFNGHVEYTEYSIQEVISHLNRAGYGDLMKLDSKDYSVISTDNPENPTIAYFNIPIEWSSKGGKMDVSFRQEPLN